MKNINLKPLIFLFVIFSSIFYLNWYYNMPEKRYCKESTEKIISTSDAKILEQQGYIKKNLDLSTGYIKKERTVEFFIVKGKYPFNSTKDTISDTGISYSLYKRN